MDTIKKIETNNEIDVYVGCGYRMEIIRGKFPKISIYPYGDTIAIFPRIEYEYYLKKFIAKYDGMISLKPEEEDLWKKGIELASQFLREVNQIKLDI